MQAKVALSNIFIDRVFVNKRFHLRPTEKPLISFISTMKYSLDCLQVPRELTRTASHYKATLVARIFYPRSTEESKAIEVTMIAYHLEAQRKQRVIDRKQEAVGRLTFQRVRKQIGSYIAVLSKFCSNAFSGQYL